MKKMCGEKRLLQKFPALINSQGLCHCAILDIRALPVKEKRLGKIPAVCQIFTFGQLQHEPTGHTNTRPMANPSYASFAMKSRSAKTSEFVIAKRAFARPVGSQ
jgi:hypothetical protein